MGFQHNTNPNMIYLTFYGTQFVLAPSLPGTGLATSGGAVFLRIQKVSLIHPETRESESNKAGQRPFSGGDSGRSPFSRRVLPGSDWGRGKAGLFFPPFSSARRESGKSTLSHGKLRNWMAHGIKTRGSARSDIKTAN